MPQLYSEIAPFAPRFQPRRTSLWDLKAYFVALVIGWCMLYTAQTQSFQAPVVRAVIPAVNLEHTSPSMPQARDDRVDALLRNMTVAQKVGQMLQIDISAILYGHSRDPRLALNIPRVHFYAKLGIGSYFNSPFDATTAHGLWSAAEWHAVIDAIQAIYAEYDAIPIIYGIDTTHGANYVRDAALFPQPLAAASSFNLALARRMGEVEAKDSLAAGLPWLFSPILGIAMQPKWSRNYETFGEDPYVASQMGVAVIRGIQANNRSAACMKHFIGYSNPTTGNDRADSVITDFELLNYYAPSFLAAIDQGHVLTAMETYTSVNGEPVIASHKLLVDLLRHDMHFDGLLVSDDAEIHRLVKEHHVAATEKEALFMVYNHTSLDMNMVAKKYSADTLTERLVNQSLIAEARLDESVRRILQLKLDLGLLDKTQNAYVPSTPVGSALDQRDAKALADEAVILLKNEPKLPMDAVNPKYTLPIEDPQATIFLTGPLADSKAHLCGGWTIFWQGTDNSSLLPHGMTIKEGLAKTFPNLHHAIGVGTDGTEIDNRTDVLARAANSTYTIVVVGEDPYAEKDGDIPDLHLPDGQIEYIRQLTKIPSTNVILVVVAGRPRLLGGAVKDAAAVILSFLPCEQGGEAIADVISGAVNPSAKLPMTYPLSSGNVHLPYFHRVNTECKEAFTDCPVQWTFGSGLSYTKFDYGNVTLSHTHVKANETLTVSVIVTNVGLRAGKEVVLLFLSQQTRHGAVPEVKLLKRFEKISLQPQESTTVRFTLTKADWSYYVPQIGQGFHSVAEPGIFHVMIKHDTVCSKKEHLCKVFRIVDDE
ncbi:Aste57867_23857 [Aphanomyces stellatus]|uniref:beta-glucosidase n=1 Tax=Aphanomyces stellatus TaxID=120398 RepID=A0A485LNR2_9STRA|nr:hypothetical protein As57867_023784 [Aphanomyces stellatus]VFU00500.1 Aste57867_23857 [Aphanomyces stellatus]